MGTRYWTLGRGPTSPHLDLGWVGHEHSLEDLGEVPQVEGVVGLGRGGQQLEVMVEYTMMVASTRGSVKWAMLGAPAEGTGERTWVTAPVDPGLCPPQMPFPSLQAWTAPHPTPAALSDATSDKVFLATPTMG